MNPLIRPLRVVSLCEGVSFLALLFIAMPLKYFWHLPEAVSFTGWIHGMLFIAVWSLILAALGRGTLPLRAATLAALASLVPGGPFLIDRMLRRLESSEPG